MEIINPKNAGDFFQRVHLVLEKDELFGNLMYGLITKLVKNENHYGNEVPFYITASGDNEINIFGLMTPPHNMTVYSSKYNDIAIDLFVNNIIEHYKSIPGINGEKLLVESIMDNYSGKTGKKYTLDKNLGIYKLEKVNEYQKPDGIFRQAEIKDREIIKKFYINFSNDCNEMIIDDEKLDKNITADIVNNNYYVYENTEITSMARKQRPTKNGMAIGPVYTLNKYRNKGYGTALVSELSKTILNSGKTFCTLFTDLSNPTSNKIYQKIGYKYAGENISYKFAIEGRS
jgi:predicted GNAT family acetyltransferase